MKRFSIQSRLYQIAAALLATILLATLISAVWAKYVREVSFSDNVRFTANLARNFELFEHQAVRDENTGAYSLDLTKEVDANSYTLIPGLDVPKDPTIRITDKSAVDAFLYIEVTNALDGVTYAMSSDWLALNIPGKTVYVYKGDTAAPMIIDEAFGTGEIKLIAADKFVVTDLIKNKAVGQTIAFRAYLLQIANETALTVDAAETVFKTSLGIA